MNDIESRLAEALAARAAGVEPHDEVDALNSISERVSMNRRRGLTVLGIAAGLMVVVGAVVLLNRDDKQQQVNIATDSSGNTTTTTTAPPPATVFPTSTPPRIWPFESSGTTFSGPEEAAKSFAVDYLGMTHARVGDTGGNEEGAAVGIFPNDRGNARTEVHLENRGTLDDGDWVVVGATADQIKVNTPKPHDPLTSTLSLAGESVAFEAQVGVELRPFGSTTPVAQSFVMGGSTEVQPFTGSIDVPSTDQPLVLILFEGDASGEQTFTKATVITLAAAVVSDPNDSATAPERTPEEAIEIHIRSFQLEYAGPCDEVPQSEQIGKYCSTLREDRGTTRIYSTGEVFSEYDTWLLLTHGSDGWTVTDAASAGTVDEPKPPPW